MPTEDRAIPSLGLSVHEGFMFSSWLNKLVTTWPISGQTVTELPPNLISTLDWDSLLLCVQSGMSSGWILRRRTRRPERWQDQLTHLTHSNVRSRHLERENENQKCDPFTSIYIFFFQHLNTGRLFVASFRQRDCFKGKTEH